MGKELTRLHHISEIMTLYGRDIIAGLLVLIIGLLMVKWLVRGIRHPLERMIARKSIAATISNVIGIVLLSMVLMVAAIEAGFKVQPIFRLAMVIFLIVIGLIIFFRPYLPSLPFKVGQTIKAQGMLGKVQATTFLNTRIHSFDGKVYFVPNKNILNGVIINYHYNASRRMKLDVPIRYDQDLIKAKRVLEALMVEDPRVLTKPRPSVWVLDLSNGCIMLGGRCWADIRKYWQTRVDLLEKIKLRFDREGIVISYPHIGVHHYHTGTEEAEALNALAEDESWEPRESVKSEG
jgi:small conductance mechanosensitive channel